MATVTLYPAANSDDCQWDSNAFYDGTHPLAPLVLGYNQDGRAAKAYIRFPSVAIPGSSVISTAVLTLYSVANTGTTEAKVKVYGNDIDNSVAPTTVIQGNALVLTTAAVTWEGAENWAKNSAHPSPDITAVIQEIISRGGWASGNAIGLVIPENGGGHSNHYCYSYNEGNAAYYPKLVIDFTPGYDVNFKTRITMIR